MTEPLERAWRAERAGVVATLARRLGDLQLAEDAVQDAFAIAAARWAVDGVPQRPGAWLTVVAWRRALDVVRRERLPLTAGDDTLTAVEEDRGYPALVVDDDRLALILACCHPALAPEARVALTLRHVAGLGVREIAAGLLVGEASMAKRLVRARRKLRDGRVSFALPDRDSLADRLASVHAVIALVFTEGHLASGDGPAVRVELCDEAVWLARQLRELLPDDDETTGLLAMLLFHHARTPARQDPTGHLVAFAEQDRALWDAEALHEARSLLAATGRGPLGPYQLQAAIAAVHAGDTGEGGQRPWQHIARLYAVLARIAPSPVVEVNRAVAVARAHGNQAGLQILQPILDGGRLDDYVPLHAAHADLLERAGSPELAAAEWQRAIGACDNAQQRRDLRRRSEVHPPLSFPHPASRRTGEAITVAVTRD